MYSANTETLDKIINGECKYFAKMILDFCGGGPESYYKVLEKPDQNPVLSDKDLKYQLEFRGEIEKVSKIEIYEVKKGLIKKIITLL